MVTIEDCIVAEQIVQEDATVQRLCKERYGITNIEEVVCDPWYYGERYCERPDATSCLLCLLLCGGWHAASVDAGRVSACVRINFRWFCTASAHALAALPCSGAGDQHREGRPLHSGTPVSNSDYC